MTPDEIRAQSLVDLQSLVEAIDRRLPRLGHIGESSIAQEAAELKEKAQQLIARLEALSKRA
jgi:hypothetical protein